jgi:hypothetical protein
MSQDPSMTETGTPTESQPDVIMDDNYGMIQVVMPPGIQGAFRDWLASRGLYLFQLPVEDDLPTYGIGVG